MIAQSIMPQLKTLRLGGMVHSLEYRIKEAGNRDLTYIDAPDKSILHTACLAGLSTNQSAFILLQPINRIH